MRVIDYIRELVELSRLQQVLNDGEEMLRLSHCTAQGHDDLHQNLQAYFVDVYHLLEILK